MKKVVQLGKRVIRVFKGAIVFLLCVISLDILGIIVENLSVVFFPFLLSSLISHLIVQQRKTSLGRTFLLQVGVSGAFFFFFCNFQTQWQFVVC